MAERPCAGLGTYPHGVNFGTHASFIMIVNQSSIMFTGLFKRWYLPSYIMPLIKTRFKIHIYYKTLCMRLFHQKQYNNFINWKQHAIDKTGKFKTIDYSQKRLESPTSNYRTSVAIMWSTIKQERQLNPIITTYDQSRSRHNHSIILECHIRVLKCLRYVWDLNYVKNPKLEDSGHGRIDLGRL